MFAYFVSNTESAYYKSEAFGKVLHYIQYFSDNRSYNSHHDGFLKYGSSGQFCTVYDDNIVYLYSEDDINDVKNKYQQSTKDVKIRIMNGAMPLVKRIIEDNISGPALMMVKLK